MAENPSYNSSHPKWRGTELADLDCGYGIKAVAARSPFKTGSFIAATGRVLGVGECVSLIRVRAGTQILGGELYWERTAAGTCVPTTVLAVGDPYCCARLIGPVNTLYQKGIMLAALQQQWAFDCSKIQKHGTTGDGCGVGYTYTCDTDIVLTNLYNDGNAYSQGGAPGAYTAGTKEGGGGGGGGGRAAGAPPRPAGRPPLEARRRAGAGAAAAPPGARRPDARAV